MKGQLLVTWFFCPCAAEFSAKIFQPSSVGTGVMWELFYSWGSVVMSQGIVETLRMRSYSYFFRIFSLWNFFTSGCRLCSLGIQELHNKFRIAVNRLESRKKEGIGNRQTGGLHSLGCGFGLFVLELFDDSFKAEICEIVLPLCYFCISVFKIIPN